MENEEYSDKETDAIDKLLKENKAWLQSEQEVQKTYQAITELVMHHNRALVARGIM